MDRIKLAWLAAVLGGAALLAWAAPRLRHDGSLAQLFDEGSAERARFAAFEAAFATDDTLLVTVRDAGEPPLLRPGALRYLDRLHSTFAGDPALAAATSLANLEELRVGEFLGRPVPLPPGPLVPRDRDRVTPEAAVALARHPLLREGLVSTDGRTAACWLVLAPGLRNAPDYLEQVEALAARVPPPVPGEGPLEVAVSGFPLLQSATLELVRADGLRFLGGALLVVALVAALGGVPARVAAAWLASWIALAGALAAWQVAADRPLHLLSNALLPLLLVTNGSCFVHVARAFAREAAGERRRTVAVSALATATTAIGFATLALSPLAPLARLGVEVAAGSALAFGATLLAAAAWTPRRDEAALAAPAAAESSPRSPFARCARAPVALVVLVALACLPWSRLRGGGPAPLRGFLDCLPAGHPRVAATRAADAAIGAQEAFEVVLELDPARAAVQLRDPAFLAELARFEADLLAAGEGELAHVLSPVTLLRYVESVLVERFDPPDPARAAADFTIAFVLAPWLARDAPASPVLAALQEALRERLAQLLTPDGTCLRFGARVRALDPQRRLALAQRLRERCFPRWRERLQARALDCTGYALLVAETAAATRATQLRSLLAGGGALALLLAAALREPRLALLAIAANALTIGGVLELGGWTRAPLDLFTTVLFAAVLACVVDHTLHLLFAWKAQRRAGFGPAAATERALARTGPSMALATLCLAAGFALFAASELPPWRQFAAGSAFGLVLALFYDLVALPAVLWRAGRRQEQRTMPEPPRAPP